MLSLSNKLKLANPIMGGFVGELDDYTSNLALALLPFRGFSSYAGKCWRLRDDGNGNAEQDVGFAANGDPVFPTLLGNGGIRYWYDQSGNGYNLPQATASAQPYLVNNILNGYPVARFDGTDDEMSTTAATGNNRTIYMVCRFRTGTASARVWKDSLTGANADVYYDSGTGKFYYYLTAPNVVDPVGGTATNWSVVTLKYTSGTTCAPWVNNTSSPSFGTTGYVTAGKVGLILGSAGGSNFGAVDIAARLSYNTAHDDTTRQAIQSILGTKFNITLA
jgi:hypothetical protein